MMRRAYEVELLTPCFCAGADPARPEIRVPSIRGHLRDWHELLRLGPVADTWGGVGGQPKASKIALRLLAAPTGTSSERILPHHRQGGGSRRVTNAGQTFDLEMLSRDADAFRRAEAAIDAWCLLGSLGLRGNRAAGSVWRPDFVVQDVSTLARMLRERSLDRLDIWISEKPLTAQVLRETASDTVSNPDYFGGIKPRVSSPVRMKAVRIDGALRLLLWSHRPIVERAIHALIQKPAPRRWQPLKFIRVNSM